MIIVTIGTTALLALAENGTITETKPIAYVVVLVPSFFYFSFVFGVLYTVCKKFYYLFNNNSFFFNNIFWFSNDT